MATAINDCTGDKILTKSGKLYKEKYHEVFEDKIFNKGCDCDHPVEKTDWDLSYKVGLDKYSGTCSLCGFMVFENCKVVEKCLDKLDQ